MSVLNIHFTDDSVEFLTDTLVYRGDEPVGLCDTKAHIAENRSFAWCTRGLCWLGDRFDHLARTCVSVDDADLAGCVWGDGITDADLGGTEGVEATIAGWSDRAGDLVVLRYDRKPGRELVRTFVPRGVHLLPRPDNLPPLPATVSPAQFQALAMAQWKVRDKFMADLCIGGIAHRTVITKDDAVQSIAFAYPDYTTHAAQFGCPNADAVALRLDQRDAA